MSREALHEGGGRGVLSIVMFIIKVCFFARLAVDISLIASMAMLVLWYISTEFELKRNADFTMHQ